MTFRPFLESLLDYDGEVKCFLLWILVFPFHWTGYNCQIPSHSLELCIKKENIVALLVNGMRFFKRICLRSKIEKMTNRRSLSYVQFVLCSMEKTKIDEFHQTILTERCLSTPLSVFYDWGTNGKTFVKL